MGIAIWERFFPRVRIYRKIYLFSNRVAMMCLLNIGEGESKHRNEWFIVSIDCSVHIIHWMSSRSYPASIESVDRTEFDVSVQSENMINWNHSSAHSSLTYLQTWSSSRDSIPDYSWDIFPSALLVYRRERAREGELQCEGPQRSIPFLKM